MANIVKKLLDRVNIINNKFTTGILLIFKFRCFINIYTTTYTFLSMATNIIGRIQS